MMQICDRNRLLAFLQGSLEEDDRLDFLIHVDDCPHCWEAVYSATKATHPQYYKKSINTKRWADLDLSGVEDSDSDSDSEEVKKIAV